MEKEIALFPLNLVVFPGEHLNLHIFEPRYKELVRDCLNTSTTFGIPSYVLTKIEYGTEVKIVELTKQYDDGRMDIKTVGLRAFRVLEYENPWQHHLYAGGVVELHPEVGNIDQHTEARIRKLIRQLFHLLKSEEEISLDDSTSIYEVIHKIGLKLDEEYALLAMNSEQDRQNYILTHLEKLIPMLQRAEHAREKIRMNGHFKHMDPLKF